jgi:nitrate reductase NapAB chaperone NapD
MKFSTVVINVEKIKINKFLKKLKNIMKVINNRCVLVYHELNKDNDKNIEKK